MIFEVRIPPLSQSLGRVRPWSMGCGAWIKCPGSEIYNLGDVLKSKQYGK
jgi:hypothetical protein